MPGFRADGFWKGSALAVVLDVMAALLSGGKTTHEIGAQGDEYAVSQAFIAIDATSLSGPEARERLVNAVVEDLHRAGEDVRYPGEGMLKTRQGNMAQGVPVDEAQWENLLKMG